MKLISYDREILSDILNNYTFPLIGDIIELALKKDNEIFVAYKKVELI